MPRKKHKKIGRRFKHERTNKLSSTWKVHIDHNYCLDPNLDSGPAINPLANSLDQVCETETLSFDEEDPTTQGKGSINGDISTRDWDLAMTRFTEVDSPPHTADSEITDSDGASAQEFYVILDRPYMYQPDENLEEFVHKISKAKSQKKFALIRKSVQDYYKYNQGYSVVCKQDSIVLIQLYPSEVPIVKWSVSINSSCEMSLIVHRRNVTRDNDFWIGLPFIAHGLTDVRKVIDKLERFDVCTGNWEECFLNLIPSGASITSPKSSSVAYREENCGSPKYSSTIRSTRCSLLVRNNERCQHCAVYRSTLRSKKRKSENTPPSSPENVQSCRPHKTMSHTQLVDKIENLQRKNVSVMKDNAKLRREIFKQISANGQTFNDSTNDELLTLVESHTQQVHQSYPDESSLHRLFWDEQLKYNKLKDKRGMRWHPMIVKWSLYLQHKSPKTYESLKDSGFISLPSTRTLFDYSHLLPSQLGLNPEVTKHLVSELKGYNIQHDNHTAYVGLLQDEIKVREGLVYDSGSDELIGFTDLDKTANRLSDIEHVLKKEKRKLATSMLVVMVRGITTNLKYPFAAYATLGVTADVLYTIIWNCVKTLEVDCGLKVLFVTCDGASPNRKFFNMHKQENAELPTYYTWNTYAIPRRKLFFISDVPHLLKTTRNCFANSNSHKLSRKLWKDGKDISWMHIVNLFEDYCESNLYRMCPKLTRAHVDLTSFSQMKVNLAAQIFSKTVGNALEELYGDQVSETVKFIFHMNKFFDCLNVRNLAEGRNTRNRDLDAYCEADDARLEYLLTEFLGYFDSWKESVANRQGTFTKGQQASMMLSHQTLDGLQISVRSIVECVRFMLGQGAEFVLTHRFNQDPLEEHFAHYRHKGGSNDNPTVYQVRNTLSTMRTVGSQALSTVRGNITRKRDALRTIDNEPLQKRPKK